MLNIYYLCGVLQNKIYKSMKKITFLSLVCLLLVSCTMGASKKKEEQKPEAGKETVVLMKTTAGDMKIKLYNETPQHRDNFTKLVKEKYYDGLLFHRVIKDFMIQGGDPNSKNAPRGVQLGMGDPGYTIPAEILPQLKHKKGALAAARTNNPERRSSGSQFYIVHNDNGVPHLDGAYTVFGEVIEGMNVIDTIANVKTLPGDRPEEDVKIMSVTLVK
jgi:peptidyl-prolyl cis-trans isomerase B (cyclophilin B)